MSVLLTPPGDRLSQPDNNVYPIESLALAHEGFFNENGVLVNQAILPDYLERFTLNPVVDPAVPGIHGICLESVRQTKDKTTDQGRTHRLYSIEFHGHRHAIEITDPADREASYVVLSFPGFTECIEGDFRKKMHASLSNLHPHARIVSIGTNGIGSIGDKYDWSDRKLHGVDAMGAQRLGIAKALSGDLPVFNISTSMGTEIAQRMAEQNLFTISPEQRINLVGLCFISPALVDPENIMKDMAIKFIPGMLIDVIRETGLKSTPLEIGKIIVAACRYGLKPNDAPALLNQLFELLAGTSEARLSSVVAEVPTAVIAGELDSLAQWKMWHRIQTHHPHQLTLEMILKRGHGLPMKPEKSADKSTRVSRRILEEAIDLSVFKQAA